MSKSVANSEALGQTLEVDRIMDHIKGTDSGPTVVFFAGIHGNEPAGVFALKEVLDEISAQKTKVNGEIYAIAGNLGALGKNVRFQKEDLNRIWTPERMDSSFSDVVECSDEEKELLEIRKVLFRILEEGKPPFYFMDLHTTSSDTTPFMVLNDSLLNRNYAANYPLPIILGIEEYLEGALLSYINELGYVSLGFESGQHNDIKAIQNHADFIRFSLYLTSSVQASEKEQADLFNHIKQTNGTVAQRFYEIYHEHKIAPGDNFKMYPGFINFQHVPKGESIAVYNGEIVKANRHKQIFMPLYQDQGSEGFYFIRVIPKIWLQISRELRRFKVDHLLAKLPGVRWKSDQKDTLVVNQRIARYMARSFFHLLGYRARRFNEDHLVVKNREGTSKTKMYKNTPWF